MNEDHDVKEVVDSFCTLNLIEKMTEYMKYFGIMRISSYATNEELNHARKKQHEMIEPIGELLEEDLIKKGIKKERLKELMSDQHQPSLVLNIANQLIQTCEHKTLKGLDHPEVQYIEDVVYSLLYFIVNGYPW